MKIKTLKKPYEEVQSLPPEPHIRPGRQNPLFRKLIYLLSIPELKSVCFQQDQKGMERIGSREPCLFLMNHSSFLDLKIAAALLKSRPYHIVCTYDALVGKKWLMEQIGCIPTRKFVSEMTLIRDMLYVLKDLKSSILMFPEAGYTFDGTSTTLPESLGKCLKLLKVPVVMITTFGAFAHDPLYNGLQLRKVGAEAHMEYLLSPEDIASKSAAELNEILQKSFSFDQFRWQQENQVRITEPFRADGLNKVLYKCPNCGQEGKMLGKGTILECRNCGKQYELTELGTLEAKEGRTEFPHIPDWYRWERECVRNELLEGTYHLKLPVDIMMLVDSKQVYEVGSGILTHSPEGFHLTGCGGKLDYTQKPTASHSICADFDWYELGDIINIGDEKAMYYCFPKEEGDVVAKIRLAAEELYKILRIKKRGR